MAKTLREFLEERAKDDLHAAIIVWMSVTPPLGLQRNFALLASDINNHDEDCWLPLSTLTGAAMAGISLTGECIKKIERERPQAIGSNPEIPWASLKRMRDIYTHWEQNKFRPEDYEHNKVRLEKEINRITPYIPSIAHASGVKSELLLNLCFGLKLYSAIWLLMPDRQNDMVRINHNANIQEACGVFDGMQPNPLQPNHLTLLFIYMAHRTGLNIALDAINRTSCFFQSENAAFYQGPALKRLRNLRNNWAHFHDLHSETGIGIMTPEEILESSRCIDTFLRSMKPDFAIITDKDDVEGYAEKLAHRYERNLMGRDLRDKTKAAIIDDAVQWITSTLNDKQRKQANAAVFAATKMVKALPVQQARETLDFLKTQSLDDPNQWIEASRNLSPPIKMAVRDFVLNTQRDSSVTPRVR